MGGLFFAAAAGSLAISLLILISLFSNGWDFFANVVWADVFSSDVWAPGPGATTSRRCWCRR